MEPIILDRSTLEGVADCPYQGYLHILFEAIKAASTGVKVFPWEEARVIAAKPELVEKMKSYTRCGMTSELCQTGIEVHLVIEKAFAECEGNLEIIPDWIVENIPKCRPDIQPHVIVAARHVCDMLADLHVRVIGTEQQMEWALFPEIGLRPAVVATQCLDILAEGLNQSLHSWDWKSGYKRWTNSQAWASFQGQCGALMMWKSYPDVETIHWWYKCTRDGNTAYARYDRNKEHPRLPGLTQEVAFEARVKEAAKLLLNDNRECRPTEQKCLWCDFVIFCREAHIAAKEIADNPSLFIDRLMVDMMSVKRRKGQARAWVQAKGAIEGKDVVFCQKPPSKTFSCAMMDKEAAEDAKKHIKKTKPEPTGDDEIDSFFS